MCTRERLTLSRTAVESSPKRSAIGMRRSGRLICLVLEMSIFGPSGNNFDALSKKELCIGYNVPSVSM